MAEAILDAKASHLWGIVGRAKQPHDPSEREMVRFFMYTFGFSPSAEEALLRVENQMRIKPELARRYRGWIFSPFLASFCYEITHDGRVLKYRNDKVAYGS